MPGGGGEGRPEAAGAEPGEGNATGNGCIRSGYGHGWISSVVDAAIDAASAPLAYSGSVPAASASAV
jgi:hypothetical protein